MNGISSINFSKPYTPLLQAEILPLLNHMAFSKAFEKEMTEGIIE